jgi:predicted SprT family Zn-dependent metalloprotease
MSRKRPSDPHYYSCPNCQQSRKVRAVDKDRHGNWRYQCGTCKEYFVEASLKLAARQRFMGD